MNIIKCPSCDYEAELDGEWRNKGIMICPKCLSLIDQCGEDFKIVAPINLVEYQIKLRRNYIMCLIEHLLDNA